MKLTKRLIDGFVYEGGSTKGGAAARDFRWETATPGLGGFGVRVYPSGKKAFVLSYRVEGRKRLMVLGRVGVSTLDEARNKAVDALRQVDLGVDPLAEKEKARAAKTFGELADAFIVEHAKPHKKTWKTDDARLKRHVPMGWRNRRVASIAQAEVAALHREIGARTPYEANRFLDLLHVLFQFAKTTGALRHDAPNPADGNTKFREKKRRRFASAAEVPYLARAIDRESSVYVRACLWLYLLTGARKSELLPRRWTDIDTTTNRMKLPDTKAGQEQFIPLSSASIAILQAIPREDGNPHIFVGTRRRRPLVNISKPWRRVREAATVMAWADDPDPEVSGVVSRVRSTSQKDKEPALADYLAEAKRRNIELPTGMVDLRLHDLRRTVGSWLTQSGVELNLLKDALRHQHISTTLGYAVLGQDPARAAFEQHGERIIAAAGRMRLVTEAPGT
ncbi:MAG: site-specific integrase [Alphaproteobacteria bacterium]